MWHKTGFFLYELLQENKWEEKQRNKRANREKKSESVKLFSPNNARINDEYVIKYNFLFTIILNADAQQAVWD